MSEVSALRKHPCPECGGDAEWNAAKKALACPYCGTVLPWSDGEQPTGANIREHDLEEALARISPASRGLHAEKTSVRCESCHAISIFDPDRSAQRCDFCASPAIVPIDDLPDAITPESLLPAVIPQPQVREQLRKWYASRWWAPNRLKRAALTDTLHGIYLPYWTFDAHVEAHWTAEAGYHYYETEQYTDGEGRRHTRQVQRTRWQPASGSLRHFFDDDAVPGTVGVHAALLRQVEPFPTLTDLKPYDPVYVRGWTVERYQIDLRLAAQTSHQQMEATVHHLCARDIPGDTHRNLRVASTYSSRTFKLLLVPVWLVTYTNGAKSYQVVVNGYTGKMAGEHPLSWVKITLAALAALLLLTLIYFYQSQA